MIELTANRVIETLRASLPAMVQRRNNYWKDIDLANPNLLREIVLTPPRDDDDCAYFYGKPGRIADYPAIAIRPLEEVFVDEESNLMKNTFQYEDHAIEVMIFCRFSVSETREYLERGFTRFIDCVLNALKENPTLKDVNGRDPIAKTFGIRGSITYPDPVSDEQYFYRMTIFDIVYRTLDSLRTRDEF